MCFGICTLCEDESTAIVSCNLVGFVSKSQWLYTLDVTNLAVRNKCHVLLVKVRDCNGKERVANCIRLVNICDRVTDNDWKTYDAFDD